MSQKLFKQLRLSYPEFIYESFHYEKQNDKVTMWFHFHLSDNIDFKPTLTFHHAAHHLPDSFLENIVFHIGMVELISYWKAACAPRVIIKPFSLSATQINWWKKLYYHGLGEFFHLNQIITSPDDLMQIISISDKPLASADFDLNETVMVPVGGGKDSAVTLELLKNSSFPIIPMAINPRQAMTDTVKNAEAGTLFRIDRTIDKNLLDLNRQGFLNGHTPFSAIVAFSGLLAAAMTGTRHIALSNESSANEPTIPGTKINHQYSKSFEFETDFRQYVKTFIHPEINYFSFLRPLNELQIAQLFSGFPQHFQSFRSCNVGSKTNSWCGSCSKCLFTAIILSPYLERDTITNIFHKDILNDASLKHLFNDLAGWSKEKPFECVGTIDEVNLALTLSAEKWGKPLPFLLDYFVKQQPRHINMPNRQQQRLDQYHYLTPAFLEILKTKLHDAT